MEATGQEAVDRRGSRRRIAAWAGAALILLLAPLVAMQLTEEVRWEAADFALFAALIAGVAVAYEVAVRKTGSRAYRAGAAMALAAAFLLVWVNGAVGILGSEDEAANRLYFGVLAVGILGALVARFRPRGMARALAATALAQAAVAGAALLAGWGAPASGPLEIVALNGFFVALFLGAAALFRKAGPEPL